MKVIVLFINYWKRLSFPVEYLVVKSVGSLPRGGGFGPGRNFMNKNSSSYAVSDGKPSAFLGY